MTEQQVVAPPSPYKGLAAFEDSSLDALFFFGRERESEIVAANLLAYRLTVLYGASGVGKSSLLHAGVVHRLRRQGEEVVLFSTWSGDAAPSLISEVRGAAAPGRELYVILDQFDEYFLYHELEDEFARELAKLVTDPDLRVNVLISIRDDMLSHLDRFKALIPNLFSNYLRLDHLDRRAARDAVVGPLERYNALVGTDDRMTAEPELVEAVLDGSGSDGRIEAPYLQLVMQRLWEEDEREGTRKLSLRTLEQLGGAEEIVRGHLVEALDRLSSGERDLAAALFNHLVTPSGTKIAHGAADLAQYASVSEADVAPVLVRLSDERILRPVTLPGAADGARYEIFHDVLAEPVVAWRARYEAERELELTREDARRRHRRLLVLAGAALLAVAVMVGMTVFAFSQRSEARSQAKRAHVRALTESALAVLAVNPERSLRFALDAAKTLQTPGTEGVLRKVLLQSYERVRLSPDKRVASLAFSPDGRWVATAGAEAKVRLFSLPDGRLKRTLGAGGAEAIVTFDATGKLVLAGGTHGSARLWDVATGRLIATLRHRRQVTDASFARSGLIATASLDRTVRLWRSDGKFLRSFPHSGPHAVLSPRGDLLATLAYDRMGRHLVRIFVAPTGRLIRTLPENGMIALAFSPNGRMLATGSADATARLWDARTGRLLHRPLSHRGHVRDVAFSPDGRLLATASEDGGTWVWDVATGARHLVLAGAAGHTVSVDFSRDGRFLVSSSLDGSARVFSLGLEGTLVAQLVGHRGGVTSATFSPDGRLVGTVGEDGTARLWDPGAEDQLQVVRDYDSPVTSAAIGSDGRTLVSTGREVWIGPDFTTAKALRYETPVAAAGFVRRGQLVFVAVGEDVLLVRTRTGEVVNRIRTGVPVESAAVSPDAALVATGQRGGRVQVWRVADRSRLGVLAGESRPIFSPDGKTLATAGADHSVTLWDIRDLTVRRPLVGHTNVVNEIEFSRDGRRLVTASRDEHVGVWDVATGKLIHLLGGFFGEVRAASFSPDARWVVGGGPTTALVWDASNGRVLPLFLRGYLRGHTAALTSAFFAPDGRRIFTGSLDGTVRLYDCAVCGGLDSLVRLAERRLLRISPRPS